MRPYLTLVLLSLILVAQPANAGPAGDRPKSMNDMSVEELREEVRRLDRDDVPYIKYVRAIMKAADEAWPKLKESERHPFIVHVYWQVVDAMRLLTGNYVLPPSLRDAPFDPRYSAAMELSFALEKLKLHEQGQAFYKEVFASDSFQKSTSAYCDAVIDLAKRYEKAGRAIPYSQLMALNQPGMGHPRGSTIWTNLLHLGQLYADLGEHASAAEWFAKVPPEGMGLLKAADAYFAAARHDEAAVRYRQLLGSLDEWEARKVRLRATALSEPLESADLQKVKTHAEGRLTEIGRMKTGAAATKPATPPGEGR